jgi:signal peptidase I
MYEIKTDEQRKSEESASDNFKRILSKIFDKLLIVIVLLGIPVALYLVMITPHQVDGKSMYPTYKNEEYLIANKLIYKLSEPQRGDVVIFRKSATQDYIKRIIGLPGDTITLKDGYLLVNGGKLDESSYLSVETDEGAYLKNGSTRTVPEGEYFVSGDNRPKSSDSRSFGPIKEEDIKGKVWFVFLPIENFRLISSPDYE